MDTSFTVLLVGDGGVGKSVLLDRLKTGEFEKRYLPTEGSNIISIPFYTDSGSVELNCIDTAGQERYSDTRITHYTGAHAAIVMFDVTSRLSFRNTTFWINEVKRVCGDIPIVLCAGKNDCVACLINLS